MALDYVILGGGSRSLKIKTSPDVFTRIPNTQIVPGLAIPASIAPPPRSHITPVPGRTPASCGAASGS